ncbi:MAG: hypothetical protein PHZ26_05860 [Candidatus Gracilibacteria bacterium]|nr:hypothetical protein [Candidatus Gracilibacteria bacterium]
MSLEIKDIKLNKKIFNFGEDTELNLCFFLKSAGKEYSINSIFIEYGVEIKLNGKVEGNEKETLVITDKLDLSPEQENKFEVKIPIKYPNLKKGFNLIDKIELINYIKIVADIKLNLFDISEIIYPKITFNENKWGQILLEGGTDSKINELKKQLEELIIYSDKEAYDELGYNIDDLTSSYVDGEIKEIEYDKKLSKLISEQNKLIKYKDEGKYKEIKKELDIELSDKENKSEYNIKKTDSNYTLVDNISDDYINKDFYVFLVSKNFLFKVGDFLRKNKKVKLINKISLWYISIIIGLNILLSIFNEFIDFSFANKIPEVLSLIIIILLLFSLFYIPFYYLFSKLGLPDTKKIINIKFNDKKLLKKKIQEKTLRFEDIFKNFEIKYNGNYSCEFSMNLECNLRIFVKEGYGKYSKYVNHDQPLYEINLGNYSGNSFNIENISKFATLDKISSIILPLKYLGQYSSFNIFKNYISIVYKITYSFVSPDLPNKEDEIVIT